MKRVFLILTIIALSLSCFAQNVKPYLEAKDLPDAVFFLPPPPGEDSPAFKLDEAQYEWGKTQRGGERGLRARREGTVDVDTMAKMFSGAFGVDLSAEKTPKTINLLKRSIRTFRLGAANPKATYMRLRPFVVHREGTLIPEDEEYERKTGSYPSGHTVRGWGMALVLSQLNPQRQDTLLKAGYEWGQSRIIAGYHWQSDVDASRLLASATFARLQSCPEYLEDLSAAEEELKANKKSQEDKALEMASVSSPQKPVGSRLTDYVNPFLGTTTLWEKEDLGYERHREARTWGAETFPGASLPNAMVQLTPVTMYHSGSGYQYEDTTICGFAHTSKGHWNLCHVPILPVTGRVNPADYASAYSHARESARPGYYQVYLERYGVNAELTSTLRCGYHKYTFHPEDEKKILVDITRSNNNVREWSLRKESDYAFSGSQWGDGKIYFYAVTNYPIGEINQYQGFGRRGGGIVSVIDFPGSQGEKALELKIGFSFVSVDNARENLKAEMLGKDFAQVCSEADAQWEQLLGRISVKGGSERQKKLFYSTLYRSFLWPSLRSDCNGDYLDIQGNVVNNGFRYYTDPSFWDDHRNKLILLGLISPDVAVDVIKSITDKGEKRDGFMPTFFHGDHASTFISGSWRRGIQNFDLERAYKLILKNATVAGKNGRIYMDEYLERGWISDKDSIGLPYYVECKGGVQKVLEYSYDDYATAQVAKILGDKDNYKFLMKQSQNYKNVFDASTGFYRGRADDGQWCRDFDPYYPYFQHMWREANAWNVLFYPPHDPLGVIGLYPSKKAVEAKLDSLFTEPWRGYEVENMTGFIGQYCHGNQPGHNIPYTYYFIGKQEKSQHYINMILDRFYDMGKEKLAYAGMDDAGEMSSWYVFNAIGLYTYSPADPEYIITVPLFDEVDFTLADGKVFTIKKTGDGEKIKSIRYDGKRIKGWFLQDSDLKKGKVLTITTE